MDNISKELQAAIDAAKFGASYALKYFDNDSDIKLELKGDNTPVTLADKESEELIRKHISNSFPGAMFVGEEGGGNSEEKEFWIIDPIDGTRSFSRGIPGWCTQIALYRNLDFQLGVCHFPIFNRTLYAERGKGAYLNDKRINVSKIDDFSETYFAHGNPRYMKDREPLSRLTDAAGSVRSWETTYSVSLLAEGKVDTVLEGYALLWDYAPWAVIIPEAGGRITRMDGTELTLNGRGYVATNGLLHDQVLEIINK